MNSKIWFVGIEPETTELMMKEINGVFEVFKGRISNLEILQTVAKSYLCHAREAKTMENTFFVTG